MDFPKDTRLINNKRLETINQFTSNRFLNFFHLDAIDTKGNKFFYFISSRAKKIKELKAVTHENPADGVLIYALYGEFKDQVVLIRQYRYSIDDYIYEFPAGLIENGEDIQTAAIREIKEETGLILHPIDVNPMYTRPYFTSVGMTDESCAAVYGIASGTISKACLEDTEEIEVVFADRNEARRILREENVALMCAYQLMHFISSESGKEFDFLNPEIQ